MIINYDDMLANYKKNLETNLRGFNGGPPPFEDWVPYEGDTNKSLKDIIELARNSGHEIFHITADKIKSTWKSPRAVKIEEALKYAAKSYGYDVVSAHSLRNNILTIDYEDTVPGKQLHNDLIKIEGDINKALDVSLDLQTLNVDDKNKRTACGKA